MLPFVNLPKENKVTDKQVNSKRSAWLWNVQETDSVFAHTHYYHGITGRTYSIIWWYDPLLRHIVAQNFSTSQFYVGSCITSHLWRNKRYQPTAVSQFASAYFCWVLHLQYWIKTKDSKIAIALLLALALCRKSVWLCPKFFSKLDCNC